MAVTTNDISNKYQIKPLSKKYTDASKPYALVTGSSLGIGRSMVHRLASLGYNIILVALPEQGLLDLAKELENTYNVKAIPYGIDLTKESAPKEILDYCTANKLGINILINNAGFGLGGLFQNIDIAR
ncbi:MAG: SDR family NAD(P)-dependent oxidoreductase, partial [Chitinophagales bacterium]